MTIPPGGDDVPARSADELGVHLPDEPPALTPGAARALLRLLLAEAGGPPPGPKPEPEDDPEDDSR